MHSFRRFISVLFVICLLTAQGGATLVRAGTGEDDSWDSYPRGLNIVDSVNGSGGDSSHLSLAEKTDQVSAEKISIETLSAESEDYSVKEASSQSYENWPFSEYYLTNDSVSEKADDLYPVIDGNWVAWIRNGTEVWIGNVRTGLKYRINEGMDSVIGAPQSVLDLSGDHVVWNQAHYIYLYTISTGTIEEIGYAYDVDFAAGVAVDGNIVVYNTGILEKPDNVWISYSLLAVYDIQTGETRYVNKGKNVMNSLELSDGLVAYYGGLISDGDQRAYVYDIDSEAMIWVSDVLYDHGSNSYRSIVDISHGTVVYCNFYLDNMTSQIFQTNVLGINSTLSTSAVSPPGKNCMMPGISDDWIVYAEWGDLNVDVVAVSRDLLEKRYYAVTQKEFGQGFPSVSGNVVVWQDGVTRAGSSWDIVCSGPENAIDITPLYEISAEYANLVSTGSPAYINAYVKDLEGQPQVANISISLNGGAAAYKTASEFNYTFTSGNEGDVQFIICASVEGEVVAVSGGTIHVAGEVGEILEYSGWIRDASHDEIDQAKEYTADTLLDFAVCAVMSGAFSIPKLRAGFSDVSGVVGDSMGSGMKAKFDGNSELFLENLGIIAGKLAAGEDGVAQSLGYDSVYAYAKDGTLAYLENQDPITSGRIQSARSTIDENDLILKNDIFEYRALYTSQDRDATRTLFCLYAQPIVSVVETRPYPGTDLIPGFDGFTMKHGVQMYGLISTWYDWFDTRLLAVGAGVFMLCSIESSVLSASDAAAVSAGIMPVILRLMVVEGGSEFIAKGVIYSTVGIGCNFVPGMVAEEHNTAVTGIISDMHLAEGGSTKAADEKTLSLSATDATLVSASEIISDSHAFVVSPDGRIVSVVAETGEYLPESKGEYDVVSYSHEKGLFSDIETTSFRVKDSGVTLSGSYCHYGNETGFTLTAHNQGTETLQNVSAMLIVSGSTSEMVYSGGELIDLLPGEEREMVFNTTLPEADVYTARGTLLYQLSTVLDTETLAVPYLIQNAEDAAILGVDLPETILPESETPVSLTILSYSPDMSMDLTIPEFGYSQEVTINGTESVQIMLPPLAPDIYSCTFLAEKDGKVLDQYACELTVTADGTALLLFQPETIYYVIGDGSSVAPDGEIIKRLNVEGGVAEPIHVNLTVEDLLIVGQEADVSVTVTAPDGTQASPQVFGENGEYSVSFSPTVNGTYILKASAEKPGWRICGRDNLYMIVGEISPLQMDVKVDNGTVAVFVTENGMPSSCSLELSSGDNTTSLYTDNGMVQFSLEDDFVISAEKPLFETAFFSSESVFTRAHFTAADVWGEVPFSVSFEDLSTGSPDSWQWDFGDGQTSSEQNPVHTYTEWGTYDVTLTTANMYGTDTTVQEAFVVVTAPPTPTSVEISPTGTIVAPGESIQFTASCYDQEGEMMENVTFNWTSSSPSVGTVNETGWFFALSEGTCNVNAEIGSILASSEVEVRDTKVHYVGKDGAGNFSTIQSAVDAAYDGDTIRVLDGTYEENIALDKSVALESVNGCLSAIIVHPDILEPGIHITADNASVSGFTIRGIEGCARSCIKITRSSGNTISGNLMYWDYYGLKLKGAKNARVYDNAFINSLYNIATIEDPSGCMIWNNTLVTSNVAMHETSEDASYAFYLNDIIYTGIADPCTILGTGSAWNSTEEVTYTYNGTSFTGYAGNYWSVYSGADSDNDGIGDSSYLPDSLYPPNSDAEDSYPLIAPRSAYFAGTMPPQVPLSINSGPDGQYVNEGETLQLSCTVLDCYGDAIDDPKILWSSSEASVGTVSESGLFSAEGAGTVKITSMCGFLQDSLTIRVVPLNQQILYVGWEDGMYRTIQSAVDAAYPGDRIVVTSGYYGESVTIDKQLDLVSESGSLETTIDGDYNTPAVTIEADGVLVSGFTITHDFALISVSGISLLHADSCNIRDNRFIKNPCHVSLTGSSFNTIEDNTMINSENAAFEIITGSSGNEFVRNTIKDTNYVQMVSMGVTDCNDNEFYLNTVKRYDQIGSEYNIHWNSSEPVTYWYGGTEHSSVIGNYWEGYSGTDANGDGIGDTPFATGADAADSAPLLKESICYPPEYTPHPSHPSSIIYVDQNGGGDFLTIKEAIDAALPEDWIMVSPGTYDEKVLIDKDVRITSEITLGHWDESTFITSSEGSGSVVTIIEDGVELSGFTVSLHSPDYGESAICVLYTEDVKLRDNRVEETGVTGEGGAGITIRSSRYPTLHDNVISGEGSYYGIILDDTRESNIAGNLISGYKCGISLDGGSNYNFISDNNITEVEYSIDVMDAGMNYVFTNDLKGDIRVCSDFGCWFQWHSPSPVPYFYNGTMFAKQRGNYWINSNLTDADGDGIGDVPYVILESPYYQQEDPCPLMRPFEVYNGGAPVLTSVEVSPSSAALNVTESIGFTAHAYDQSGFVMPSVSLEWASSDENVGTVNETGHFTALYPGTTHVSASSEGIVDTAEVVVSAESITANFTADNTSGEVPLRVNFTSLSKGGITGYAWSFGDGLSSQEENPVHEYTSSGVYTVSLRVSSNYTSDTMTRTDYIDVYEAAVLDCIEVLPTEVIVNASDSVIFSATGYDRNGHEMTDLSFSWICMDNATGAVNQTGGYTALSDHTNAVVAVSGDVQGTALINPISAGFSADNLSGYAPLHVQFTDQTLHGPAEWTWDFNSDGVIDSRDEDPEYVYEMPGVYSVTLIVGNDLSLKSLTEYDYITVSEAPEVTEISLQPEMAMLNEGENFTFTAMAIDQYENPMPDAVFAWSSSDEGVATISQNGTVNALFEGMTIITATSGTVSADAEVVVTKVIIPPVAGFSADVRSGDAPLEVSFTDLTANSPAEWLWDFGDGYTSGEQNPVHLYYSPGNYTVSLTVLNIAGEDCLSEEDYIVVTEKAHLTRIEVEPAVANVTEGDTLQLSALGFDQNDVPMDGLVFDWRSNNEGAATVNDLGLVTAHAMGYAVISAGNASVHAESDINILKRYEIPLAQFSADPTDGEAPLIVTFTDISANDPTEWRWNFGDGNISTLQDPVHTYYDEGNYSVTLTALNPAGEDSMEKTGYVTVTLPPYPASLVIEPASVNMTVGDTIVLNATVQDQYGSGMPDAVVSWSSSNESVVEVDLAGHVSALLPGNADITASCDTLDASAAVSVAPRPVPPVADFSASPTSGDAPLTVTFSDLSENTPTEWEWDFGDGMTDTVKNPVHTYNSAGVYTVVLTVSNAAGSDMDSNEGLIDIHEAPHIAWIEVEPAEAEMTVGSSLSLAATAYDQYDNQMPAVLFSWSSSNESVAAVDSTGIITAASSGVVRISAVNQTISGFSDITVLEPVYPPEAEFSVNVTAGEAPLAVVFTDLSENVPTEWLWDFGDGATSIEQNPVHLYSDPGNYTVVLSVANEGGSDSLEKEGYISAQPPQVIPQLQHYSFDSAEGWTNEEDKSGIRSWWFRSFNICPYALWNGHDDAYCRYYTGLNARGEATSSLSQVIALPDGEYRVIFDLNIPSLSNEMDGEAGVSVNGVPCYSASGNGEYIDEKSDVFSASGDTEISLISVVRPDRFFSQKAFMWDNIRLEKAQ